VLPARSWTPYASGLNCARQFQFLADLKRGDAPWKTRLGLFAQSDSPPRNELDHHGRQVPPRAAQGPASSSSSSSLRESPARISEKAALLREPLPNRKDVAREASFVIDATGVLSGRAVEPMPTRARGLC
jgi:hypothetical protein